MVETQPGKLRDTRYIRRVRWACLFCITMYVCVFLALRYFSLPAEGLFSCSRLRGTQGARPDITVQVWALAEVRGTCSGGSKWQVPTGSDSEHVEPSRPMQTHVQVKECQTAHVQVKRMSDGSSCHIWDPECRQCRQTLLGDGKVKRMFDGSCTG